VSAETASAAGAERRLELGRAAAYVPALVAFVPVVGLAAAQGGYFPGAWGWASVPAFWIAAIALLLRDHVRLNVAERVFLGAFLALAGWLALSLVWSVALPGTVLELERLLVLVGVVAAALLLSRGRFGRHLLAGVVAAIAVIATFSLLTRLVPDRVGVHDGTSIYRLAQPIGYWNGLGVFVAMGLLLALGFAARARSLGARALCGALLVALPPTLYFTFGRAAWLALFAGLLVAVVVDMRRLQLLAALLVLAPLPALGVYLASRERGLTHAGVPLARAAHDGHRLLGILAFLALVNAALAVALALLERRVEVPVPLRQAFAVAVTLTVVVVALATFDRYGSPTTLVSRAYTSFKAPPPHAQQNLNRRLLSFSGNGRADLWRLAWDQWRVHPALGSGAGTYERYFLVHQPANVGFVHDAHGLYVETLDELGPVGLALLLVVLLTPLAGLRVARRHPLAATAAGAYVAYLVHTGVDWDWELPAVTLAGLLCGTSLLLFRRRWRPPRPLPTTARFVGAGLACCAAIFATIGLLGNAALSRSDTARQRGALVQAATDARHARWLMPWSPAPLEELGRAQLAAGLPARARSTFAKAIQADEGDWRLWYDLARASRGRARRAALRHALTLYPRSDLLATTLSRSAP
jgi:hypothetical protein